jgi:ribonuclease P protein component
LFYARLGMVVPKRLLSRAVDRNRIKRQLRERFRLDQVENAGSDWLVRLIVAPSERAELRADIETVFLRKDADQVSSIGDPRLSVRA